MILKIVSGLTSALSPEEELDIEIERQLENGRCFSPPVPMSSEHADAFSLAYYADAKMYLPTNLLRAFLV